MIYLDSCALVKLIRTEDGSSALQEWLDQRCDELTVTSALSRAEVLRTIRRNNHRETGDLIDPAALAAELTGLRPSPTRHAVAGVGGWAPVGGM